MTLVTLYCECLTKKIRLLLYYTHRKRGLNYLAVSIREGASVIKVLLKKARLQLCNNNFSLKQLLLLIRSFINKALEHTSNLNFKNSICMHSYAFVDDEHSCLNEFIVMSLSIHNGSRFSVFYL